MSSEVPSSPDHSGIVSPFQVVSHSIPGLAWQGLWLCQCLQMAQVLCNALSSSEQGAVAQQGQLFVPGE